MKNKKMEPEELELNSAQLERLDEIYNSVFEMCKVLTEDEDLEWRQNFIGEITECAVNVLVQEGKTIRYPGVITNKDGTQYIEEFITK